MSLAKKFAAAAIAVAVAGVARPASASAIFSFSEVGSSVIGTLSGSLNINGAQETGTTPSYDPRISPGLGFVIATPGNGSNGLTGAIYNASGPGSFGTGFSTGGVATGGVFEVSSDSITLPNGYSGGALDNTLTLAGKTFASLGITTGDYVYTLAGSGDTVTLHFGNPTSVPEPASAALLLGGLGLLGAMRRRKTH